MIVRCLALIICFACTLVRGQDAAAGTPGLVPTPSFGEPLPPAAGPDGSVPPPPPADGAQPPATTAAPEAPPEQAIPQTYRDDRYQGTLSKNPFMLKTKTLEQPTASFAQDWELKYMRETKGVIKAGIQNRQTQEYRNIGPEPDAEGFKLVKATIGRNRKDSSAEVAKGSETATLTYSDAPAAPGGAPGRVGNGIVPGQPQNPGGMRPNAVPNGYRAAGNQQNPNAPMQVANMPGHPVGAQGTSAAGVPGGAAGQVPPNPVGRRRVLIPSGTPPTTPVP